MPCNRISVRIVPDKLYFRKSTWDRYPGIRKPQCRYDQYAAYHGTQSRSSDFSFCDAFPIEISGLNVSRSTSVARDGCRNLQQRELFGSCTRFPFHPSSTPGKESTKPAAKITLLSEKPPESADYFHQPPPESAGKGIPFRFEPPPAFALPPAKIFPIITLMSKFEFSRFYTSIFPFALAAFLLTLQQLSSAINLWETHCIQMNEL